MLEVVASRIIKATFRTKKKIKIKNVIWFYAPANYKDESVKNIFYIKLQSTKGS